MQYKQSASPILASPAPGLVENKTSASKFVNALRAKAGELLGKKTTKDEPFDQISDPLIRYAMKNLKNERHDDVCYHAVADARGVKLLSLKDVMGSYLMHTDDSYLSNLPKLQAGMYSVDIDTGSGDHAITYVKVSDQEGYIMDPNGFQIRCKDAQHTIQQFKKIA